MAQIEEGTMTDIEFGYLRQKTYLLTEALRRNNVSRWFKKRVEKKLAELLGI